MKSLLIAVIGSLFAVSTAEAQYLYPAPQPVYVEQCLPVPYCPPARTVVTAPPLYRDLINHGGERTRRDITVRLSTGKTITVPIINGWVPSVTLKNYSNGAERHIFDYKERKRWSGKTNQVWYTEAEIAERKRLREIAERRREMQEIYRREQLRQQRTVPQTLPEVVEPVPQRRTTPQPATQPEVKPRRYEESPFLRRPSDVRTYPDAIVKR